MPTWLIVVLIVLGCLVGLWVAYVVLAIFLRSR